MAEPKQRVRVQAGRGGGPLAEFTEPAKLAPTNLPVPVGPEPTNFLAVILRAAADPRCDVQKMQALLDMQRQIEERDAEKAFTRDFMTLQRLLPVIDRDGKIDHGTGKQKNLYSTYPNIMKVCKPLMDAHGMTLSSKVRPGADGKIVVVSTLRHIEHYKDESEFPLPSDPTGSKSPPQGWGSAQQYGMRYNAIALLNIISEDPRDRDHDGHPGKFVPAKGGGFAEVPAEQPKITAAQRDKIVELITAAKIKEQNFCTKYGIGQIGMLPAELFDAAVKAIADHVEAAKAANRG
jgi:hypothetical protein